MTSSCVCRYQRTSPCHVYVRLWSLHTISWRKFTMPPNKVLTWNRILVAYFGEESRFCSLIYGYRAMAWDYWSGSRFYEQNLDYARKIYIIGVFVQIPSHIHIPDDTFKFVFMKEYFCILIYILLKLFAWFRFKQISIGSRLETICRQNMIFHEFLITSNDDRSVYCMTFHSIPVIGLSFTTFLRSQFPPTYTISNTSRRAWCYLFAHRDSTSYTVNGHNQVS